MGELVQKVGTQGLHEYPVLPDVGLKKEMAFQEQKELHHKVRALQEGAVLDEEVTEEMLTRRDELQERDRKNGQVRETVLKRRDAALQEPLGPEQVAGACTFVEEGLLASDLRRVISRRQAIVANGWRDATLFTMRNPGRPGPLVQWAAALLGCYIVTTDFWFGRGGSVIKYKGALSGPRRKVWVSANFKT